MKEKGNSWGVASMVTGIISLCLFIMPYFSIPLGIFAIIGYAKQNKIKPNGMATAGLIMGIIGIVIGVIVGLIALIALATLSSLR